ncbi:uncharacterized protein B0P05DRAFT_525870 [Gilbertella persicaria]|uniref:uncharacterized protein n=1 Tax=Gilbertella persicaria TaxID=101096 RepID=UPI00221E8CF6|nr:uncharacterized protein B0P05DRAFT_525870 [Gilbertella persicaria]KAI8092343.1 hypothetical protein B0P05DRAFT_525870 [Gilbertella persicaria]
MSTTSEIYVAANALLIPNHLEFMQSGSAVKDEIVTFQAHTFVPKTVLLLYIKKSLVDTSIGKHGFNVAENQGFNVKISGYLQAQPCTFKETSTQVVLSLHVSELKILDVGVDIPSDIQQLKKTVEAIMNAIRQVTQPSSNGKQVTEKATTEQALSKSIARQVPTEMLNKKVSTRVFTEEVFVRELKKEISREETSMIQNAENDKNVPTKTMPTKDNTSTDYVRFDEPSINPKEADKEALSETTVNKDNTSQQVPISAGTSSTMAHLPKPSQKRKTKDNHQGLHKTKQIETSRRSPRASKRPTNFKYPK